MGAMPRGSSPPLGRRRALPRAPRRSGRRLRGSARGLEVQEVALAAPTVDGADEAWGVVGTSDAAGGLLALAVALGWRAEIMGPTLKHDGPGPRRVDVLAADLGGVDVARPVGPGVDDV